MELRPDGSCSTSNWITSVVIIPLILRTQITLRQMDTNWAGIIPFVMIILGLIIAYEIVVGGDGPFSPRAALHYFQTRECSISSPVENNSPLWGGVNMPFFCFIVYMSAVTPPMFMTGEFNSTYIINDITTSFKTKSSHALASHLRISSRALPGMCCLCSYIIVSIQVSGCLGKQIL